MYLQKTDANGAVIDSFVLPEAYSPDEFIADGYEVFADEPPPDIPPEDPAVLARNKRDNLLASTDWTQLPDAPASLKAEFAIYRQVLRDLPAHPDWPNVEWPELPK